MRFWVFEQQSWGFWAPTSEAINNDRGFYMLATDLFFRGLSLKIATFFAKTLLWINTLGGYHRLSWGYPPSCQAAPGKLWEWQSNLLSTSHGENWHCSVTIGEFPIISNVYNIYIYTRVYIHIYYYIYIRIIMPSIIKRMFRTVKTYCGWTKSCTSRQLLVAMKHCTL